MRYLLGMRRLALALLVSAPLLFGGCSPAGSVPDGDPRTPDLGTPAFDPCDTICLRPSDCQPAYNDDGYCPAGFRCAARFSCAVDGGAD